MDYSKITKENFNDYYNWFETVLYEIDHFLFYLAEKNNLDLTYSIDTTYVQPEMIEILLRDKAGDSYQFQLDELFQNLNLKFKKLLEFSNENEIFFHYCSDKVYLNTFDKRYFSAKSNWFSLEKIYFIQDELLTILNKNFFCFKRLNSNIQDQIITSNRKKIDFLIAISHFNSKITIDSEMFYFNKFIVDLDIQKKEITIKPKAKK
jgi:hypothetical protein